VKSKRELGDALVACVRDASRDERDRLLAPFSHDELAQLAQHASKHRVVPYLAAAIRDSSIAAGAEVYSSLERTHATWTAHHLLTLTDLTVLQAMLDDASIPFLVIKGPVLAERYYPSPDLRMYEDLDLLVVPSDFPKVVQTLQDAGMTLVERNWALARDEFRGQLHLTLSGGTLADIHWNVLNRERVRRGFSIATEELFTRSRQVDLAGATVRTLDPEDTLLHLCAHAALSGGDRLIWMKDIERAIEVDGPDWAIVIERAHAWRAGPTVALALARTSRTLGVTVPNDVLRSLFRGALREPLSAWLDRRWPVERSVGAVTPASLWAQVLRSSWAGTGRALANRGVRAARSLVGHTDEPASIMVEAGTSADQQAYLRAVGRDDEPQ
jgi:hypothetical protein